MKILPLVAVGIFLSFIVWFANFSMLHHPAALQVRPGKKHVLVTGGAGYIGSHAALDLLMDGHSVTIVDNLSRGNLGAIRALQSVDRNRVVFHQVDLGDRAKVFTVLKEASPPIDLVMHFAAVAYVGESMANPLLYYHNITINTVHLLEAMAEVGVAQMVYSSTCAVYGNPDQLPVTEDTPPKPINPYGAAKLAAEQAVRDVARSNPEFQAIIFRYFNVYGSDPEGRLGEWPRANLRQHARISGACLDAASGHIPELKILGTKHPTPDGTCVRDYIHVSDLVRAHMMGMGHLNNPPALFNIGTGKGVSVQEFVDACGKVTGKSIKVVRQEQARPGDYASVYARPDKIMKEMGWKANFTNVEDGLRHAWSWRKQHPLGYGLQQRRKLQMVQQWAMPRQLQMWGEHLPRMGGMLASHEKAA